MNIDTLFDNENKHELDALEAKSNLILSKLGSDSFPLENSQNISAEVMQNNPLGENSIFYKPVPKLIDHSVKEA